MSDECAHIPAEIPGVSPVTDGCQECLEIGSTWVHLRMCVTCGHVGCCDQSTYHHARVHYDANNDHVLVRSFEPGEAWWYCWADDFGFELEGAQPLRG